MVENETLRTVISGTAGAHRSSPCIPSTRSARRLQAAPAGVDAAAPGTARASQAGGRGRFLYGGLAWPLAAQGPLQGPSCRRLRRRVPRAPGRRPGSRSRRTRSSRPAASGRRGAGARRTPLPGRGGPDDAARRAAPRRGQAEHIPSRLRLGRGLELAQGRYACHAGPARGGGGGRRLPRPRARCSGTCRASARITRPSRPCGGARWRSGAREAGARCGASIELSRR